MFPTRVSDCPLRPLGADAVIRSFRVRPSMYRPMSSPQTPTIVVTHSHTSATGKPEVRGPGQGGRGRPMNPMLAAESRVELARQVHAQAGREATRLVQAAASRADRTASPETVAAGKAATALQAAKRNVLEAETVAEITAKDGQSSRDLAAAAHAKAAAAGVECARDTAAELEQLEYQAPLDGASKPRPEHNALAAAREGLASVLGTLQERARVMPDVSAAHEEVAAAKAEETRVRGVAETLRQTRNFLEVAQAEVHRNLAPRTVALVRPWLAEVTDGRYPDLDVDPTTLQVTVYDKQRRPCEAGLLSRGTTEQVYLLLRVALAELLVTTPKESAPLLLDDVTVQCDVLRTAALLGLLQRLSADRQIVMFSQETSVLEWAHENLLVRDRLIELDPGDLDGAPVRLPSPRLARSRGVA